MKTAAQAQANYVASVGRATTAYTQGVQSTTKDQAGLAVQAQARLVANFNQAVQSGRWAAGVNRGGTAFWKTQTEKKSANYGVGIAAGEAAFGVAIGKVMNALATGVGSLPPRGDINQNIARSGALNLYMHGLKGQLGGK